MKLIKWIKSHWPSNTKWITWICLIHGFLWVDCSYYFAWVDKTEVVESLSQVAVTEIIGVVLVYALKEGIANLSKNNCWPDKPQVPKNYNQDENDEGSPI